MDQYYKDTVLEMINYTNEIKKKEYINALLLDKSKSEILFRNARIARQERKEDKLYVRGSLEYSNYCSNHCSFCGMGKNNLNLKRYELSYNEAKKTIDYLSEKNIGQLHLVSGEDYSLNVGNIENIIKYATSKGISTTLVLGELKEEVYYRLYKAGARRYILKFETSNQEIFYNYKSQKSLINRLAHLMLLRDIGFKIGTGIIVGLPKTNIEDLANDMNLLTRIQPDMASASVFSPNKASELARYEQGSTELGLNFIALMRINLANTPIISCSCSSSFSSKGQLAVLNSGANLISRHITPSEHINLFSMYKSENRVVTEDEKIKELSLKSGMGIQRYV